MNKNIKEITDYLFRCDYFDESFDPEGEENHLSEAEELQVSFPWNDIIVEWHKYLYTQCKTEDDVINFANLFMYYGGADNYNPDPYKFLGYLYSQIDLDKRWDDAGDLLDSIAIDVLSYQQLIDLQSNPY